MPDYNPAVALGINAGGANPLQTAGALANIQNSNAMVGLKDIQTQQAQRQYNALKAAGDAYQSGKDPIPVYLSLGGDPTGASTLQNVFAGQKAMGVTPGGLLPQAYQELTGAGRNIAETGKIGQETSNLRTEGQIKSNDLELKNQELRGNAAKSIITDSSDENYNARVAELKGHVSPQGWAQLQNAQTPEQRKAIGAAMLAAVVPNATMVQPHNVGPTDTVTTPAGILSGSIMPNGEKIIGGGVTQDNGGKMPTTPNQRVASTFGTVAPRMSPQTAAETKQYGETLGKQPEQLAEQAENGRQQNFTLEQMKAESESWPMGKGAETLMKASQYLKPIANAFGNTSFDKPVADFESFQKNSGTLLRQAVKEVSSRAAVQEFNIIAGQLPNAGMSRQGFGQIATQFQSVNDYKIAKQQAAQAWRDTNGTMDKFDADWNKNVTPTAFLVHRMSPDELQQVATNLQKTPDGRATLNSIKRQLSWAQQNGLF